MTRVESLTEFPEMLGGRVKTLHPRIHGGILARREVEADVAALAEHGIEPFDLVCVNLYPFEQVAREHGVREEEAVEMIDVGGPAMLRAAAKNFAHVAPVCRPADYATVLAELREHGELSHETRRALAATAFSTSASYEAAIAAWFAGRQSFPDVLVPAVREAARPRLRREPAPAGRLLRASAAPARTCSRASSSCTGASSRTTT